jgi:PilZ domain
VPRNQRRFPFWEGPASNDSSREPDIAARAQPGPRYPFLAAAEIVDHKSANLIQTRVTELSSHGCYLETHAPLSRGMQVTVRIFADLDSFEARASVVYAQPRLGVGLAFREVKPSSRKVLDKWLEMAVQETYKPRD